MPFMTESGEIVITELQPTPLQTAAVRQRRSSQRPSSTATSSAAIRSALPAIPSSAGRFGMPRFTPIAVAGSGRHATAIIAAMLGNRDLAGAIKPPT